MGRREHFSFFDWGASYGGCPRIDLKGFSWEAYVNEMCALFGCDLEDLGYTLKIGCCLARCFRALHEIEHVEEQAKVGSHYYLRQKMGLLWLSVRNSKR